ncbi:hypothetical protein D9756_001484 [Leucocoprinus leucothites]|uniref:Mitochondrial carrier protein n=1 Tax=Leucocoprinus leucothites TaxID=201217 RepID=A0A8H5LI82_9AGAR|nr:hypothetical protein D9756_001484 [Leucoagaricus leucothites]
MEHGMLKYDVFSGNKAVVCALSASYVSTFAGYPVCVWFAPAIRVLLNGKCNANMMLHRPVPCAWMFSSLWDLCVARFYQVQVADDERLDNDSAARSACVQRGGYHGLLSRDLDTLDDDFICAASFTIYSRTKEYCAENNYLCRPHILDAALTGGISGAMSGSLISFGSAPFELVKVRRQLEYSIAAAKGISLVRPPGTTEAVREIFRANGLGGLYTGFKLHFIRDTAGTALYFMEYDGMRHLLGRSRSGEQGPAPSWLPVHPSLVPFVCGSVSGVTSWALIYPLDVVKTKIQQRALAGEKYRGPLETLHRLVRGPDPTNPRSLVSGIGRLYRGLGVSALRSITTHGLLWTLFDMTAHYIDNLPPSPYHSHEDG